jgi:hypothetical protein
MLRAVSHNRTSRNAGDGSIAVIVTVAVDDKPGRVTFGVFLK